MIEELKFDLPPYWVYYIIAGLGIIGVIIVIAYYLWKKRKAEE